MLQLIDAGGNSANARVVLLGSGLELTETSDGLPQIVVDGGAVGAALSTLSDVNLTALSNNEFLRYNAVAGEWVNTLLSASDIPSLDTSKLTTGVLPVARGGTGLSSLTTGNYVRAQSSSAFEERTPAQVLADIGAAAAGHAHSAADITSGTLAVARGGTGIASYTANNYIRAQSATVLEQRTPAQVLADIGAAAASHTHAATDITSGTLASARLSGAYTGITGLGTLTGLTIVGGTASVRAAATQDGVVLQGRAGGTSSYAVTVTPTTLTASRTLTLADGDTILVAGTMVPTTRTITIANGTGITGGGAAVDLSANRTWTIALTGQALALHNLATNGLIARTGSGTVAGRTITGTANQVTVTNGDGVAGDPTLALPQNIHTGATPSFAGLLIGTTPPAGAEVVRVDGSVRIGGTVYANDFVLLGGSGSISGITLDSLDDVVLNTVASGHYLRYNGTNWVNQTIPLTDLGSGTPSASNFLRGDGSWASAYIAARDEGTLLTSQATEFNFTGAGVVASNVGGVVTVNITGAVTSVFGRTGAIVATEGDYSLNLLSDVTITAPATGHFLRYNGSVFVNTALVAGDLPSHSHSAADVTSGTLAVARGGTGVGTITGIVKGNGTSAFSAAVAGTDYVVPSGSITGNAATATTLQNSRTLWGQSFNGSANIGGRLEMRANTGASDTLQGYTQGIGWSGSVVLLNNLTYVTGDVGSASSYTYIGDANSAGSTTRAGSVLQIQANVNTLLWRVAPQSTGAGATPASLTTVFSVSASGLGSFAGGINVAGNSTITGTLSGITTLTATTLAGTLSTAAQPNITSVGTLTGLTVSGASPTFNTGNAVGTLTLGSSSAATQEQRVRLVNSVVTGGVDLVLVGAGTSWGLYDRDAAKWAIQITRGATDAVGISGTLTVSGAITGSLTGNASTATTLQTSRNFSLTGDVTASAVGFNGSGNVALSTSLAASVVTGKLLTGYSVGANSAIAVGDTILQAFGKAQGQINQRIERSVPSAISTAGAGWYRVAVGAGANGRGPFHVIIYTEGGSWAPAKLEIKGFMDWGSDAYITQVLQSGTLHWTDVRVTDATGTYYVEVYFNAAVNATSYVVNEQGGSGSVLAFTALTGSLTAGGGTVLATTPIINGIVTEGGMRVAGTVYATDFVLLGGSGGTSGLLLDSLDDVVISSAASGHFLRHNGANWVNTALVAADIPNLDVSKLTTGTLSVARGGTGATTLTGLVKGNGTGAFTAAVAGTDYVIPSGNITGSAATLTTTRTIWGQNFNGSANVSGALSGATTIDASGNITTSAGRVRAGHVSATTGAVMMESNYSDGTLNVLGAMYSSGATLLAFGVRSSNASPTTFLSTTGTNVGRAAFTISAADFRWYTAGTQTVTIDNAVTMTERMSLTASALTVGVGIAVTGNSSITGSLSGITTLATSSYGAVGGSINDSVNWYVRAALASAAVSQYGAMITTTTSASATSGSTGLYINHGGAAGTYTTTNATGISIAPYTRATNQTITNLAGIVIQSSSVAATTSYGLQIGSITGAGTNYAIYTSSGLIRFGDAVTIASGSLTVSSGGLSVSTSVTTPLLIGNTTSTRDKIRVWDSSSYTIGMQASVTFGAINNNYAMTFQMNDASDRGFWWGDATHTAAQGAMALSTDGKLTVAHSIRLGYGETDTTIPGVTYRLDVSGNSYFAGTITATGNITANSSDRRLKDRVKKLDNAIDRIMKLEAMTHGWNALAVDLVGYDHDERLVGLFAQDVQEVLPEAVKIAPFDNDGYGRSKSGKNYLTIQYERIVPLLIAGQQEAILEIRSTASRVDDLEQRIVQLQLELAALRGGPDGAARVR